MHSPKQDEPNKIHIKTHYNQNVKIKDKERILKAAREKQLVTYKGTPIILLVNISAETLQTRREQHDTFKVLKIKNTTKITLSSKVITQK